MYHLPHQRVVPRAAAGGMAVIEVAKVAVCVAVAPEIIVPLFASPGKEIHTLVSEMRFEQSPLKEGL